MILGHDNKYAVHIVPYARIIVHVEANNEGEAAEKAKEKLASLANEYSEIDFGKGKYVAGSIKAYEGFNEPVEVYQLEDKYGPYTGDSWWVEYRDEADTFMTDEKYSLFIEELERRKLNKMVDANIGKHS